MHFVQLSRQKKVEWVGQEMAKILMKRVGHSGSALLSQHVNARQLINFTTHSLFSLRLACAHYLFYKCGESDANVC
jgi:hypothetical protein